MARPDGDRTPGTSRILDPDLQLPPGRGPGTRSAGGDGGRRGAEPGLSDLFRSLADDLGTLVRQEIDLAKMELKHTAKRIALDSAWIGAGAATAAVGALCLVLAMALGLGALLGSYWLGTLITGLFLVLLGGGFAFKGARDLKSQQLTPKQSAASLRENARLARDRARTIKHGLVKE
jgi:hypothetical protein